MATETWVEPAMDSIYICYNENGTPSRMCRYIDMLSEIDTDLWPRSQEDYDLLMWSYNAEPVRE